MVLRFAVQGRGLEQFCDSTKFVSPTKLVRKQYSDIENPSCTRYVGFRKPSSQREICIQNKKNFERRKPMQCTEKHESKVEIEGKALFQVDIGRGGGGKGSNMVVGFINL
jgi:hypothetical protein